MTLSQHGCRVELAVLDYLDQCRIGGDLRLHILDLHRGNCGAKHTTPPRSLALQFFHLRSQLRNRFAMHFEGRLPRPAQDEPRQSLTVFKQRIQDGALLWAA